MRRGLWPRQFRHGAAAGVRYPNVAPTEGQPLGTQRNGIGTQRRAGGGQFSFSRCCCRVRHPNVGPIKRHAVGLASHGVGAHDRAAAGQQLGDAVAAGVRHPDVGSVEGYIGTDCSPRNRCLTPHRYSPTAWSRCCCRSSPPKCWSHRRPHERLASHGVGAHHRAGAVKAWLRYCSRCPPPKCWSRRMLLRSGCCPRSKCPAPCRY